MLNRDVLGTKRPYAAVVVTTLLPRADLYALNEAARSNGVAFVLALTTGVAASLFSLYALNEAALQRRRLRPGPDDRGNSQPLQRLRAAPRDRQRDWGAHAGPGHGQRGGHRREARAAQGGGCCPKPQSRRRARTSKARKEIVRLI